MSLVAELIPEFTFLFNDKYMRTQWIYSNCLQLELLLSSRGTASLIEDFRPAFCLHHIAVKAVYLAACEDLPLNIKPYLPFTI